MSLSDEIEFVDILGTSGDQVRRVIAEKQFLLKCGFKPTDCVMLIHAGIPYITIRESLSLGEPPDGA